MAWIAPKMIPSILEVETNSNSLEELVVTYQPYRVARQFGYDKSISRATSSIMSFSSCYS